ncbi:MAG: AAA family ATPase [Acidobacteriales bacterium]|nr:AAA family ATPase [Terriglobales bacterium]
MGRNSHDPRIRTSPGEIVDIDVIRQTIDIKRKSTSQPPDCTALIPDDIVDAKPAKGSLMRLAQWVADHSISAPGPLQACRDLLQRKPPQALHEPIPVLIDEDQQLTPATRDLVLSLVSQPAALPIQGPPGSGKTFTAAKMILELVKEGHRVGVTAVSHKVIVNLLEELCRLKQSGDKSFRVIQKITDKKEEQACTADSVDVATNNAEVVEALSSKQAQIAAGTAWLWACEDMANSVDVLFVDEAGQMSLANTLAIGQAATSMVLLGDPQQLDQPKRGLHPPGTEVSALGHILAGEKTIKPTQGLFLAQTFRMHPAVCSFISEMFYDNLLLSRPENATQRILCNGPLAASGLRFVPVIHEGNQNESAEEGEAVLALITNLLAQGAQWTDKHGNTHLLRARDFLVVAPYNAQVAALTALLPPGVRVGTVDKFQGQQAPIVIYSMATSSPEDAPRGMEFLYSLNRLNVAVSRAQTLAILVASPALFHVPCNTPRQIELVNAFCRYMEIARPPVPWRMQAAAR